MMIGDWQNRLHSFHRTLRLMKVFANLAVSLAVEVWVHLREV